jgi:hypothetical protein
MGARKPRQQIEVTKSIALSDHAFQPRRGGEDPSSHRDVHR